MLLLLTTIVALAPDAGNRGASASTFLQRTFGNTGTGAQGGSTNNSAGTLGATPTLSGGRYSWTVPSTGRYRILAEGAQGGARSIYAGGLGATVTAEWNLTAGQVLRVVVGHQGVNGTNGAGGGGATGVFVTSNNLILAMAGGGGGAGTNESGVGASATSSGRSSSGAGGTNGNGGEKGYKSGDCGWAGGGGGYSTDGYGGDNTTNDGGVLPGTRSGPGAGFSYLNGGAGSTSLLCNDSVAGQGGFGAAGGGVGHYGGGGGGGYSGGGGGQYVDSSGRRGGGGGGSFVAAGSLTSNIVGVSRSGHGNVVITLLAPAPSTFAAQGSTPTNQSSLIYDLVFSESVTGLTASDFSIGGTSTGWMVASVDGSGSTYTVTLSNSSPPSGTVILTLLQNAVLGDSTQQNGPGSNVAAPTMTIDVDPPGVSVSSSPSSPNAGMSLTFGLSFTESVSGISSADFSNVGSALGCVFTPSAASGVSVNVVVTQCQEGTLRLGVAAGSVVDAAGNTGPTTVVSSSEVTLLASGLTVTAGSQSVNYGGSWTDSFTQSGLIGGDTVTVGYSYSGATNDGVAYGPSGTKPTEAGTYSIAPVVSYGAGNSNRYALTSVNGTLTIARVAQTALVVSSTSATYGQPLTLTTSGGSGTGAVTWQVTAGDCSVSGSVLTPSNAGSMCEVRATKAADNNYLVVSSVATAVSIAKATQTPLVVSSTSATYGQQLTLTTSGGSGTGAVTWQVVSGTCSVSGSRLTVGNAGSLCVVRATKATDVNYVYRDSADTTITVAKANQTGLAVTSPSVFTTGDSLTLTASGGQSTGVLSWLLNNGSCSLTGSVLTAARGGITCEVQVTRAGDANHNALSVSETITVDRIIQVLTFTSTAPTNPQIGDTYTVTVTSSAFLAPTVAIANSSASVCSIQAGVVTFNASGVCLVSASQAGNDVYSAAALSQSVTVGVPATTVPSVVPASDDDPTSTTVAPSRQPVANAQTIESTTTTSTTTTTTTIPTPDRPVLNQDGSPIELAEGETTAFVQGKLVTVRKQSVDGQLVLSLPNNVSMSIGVLPGGDTPAVFSAEGELRVYRKDQFLVSAEGLMPGTTYTVFMFSEPRELARGVATGEGTVASGVRTPDDAEHGDHTLQLNGVGPDGEVVSISLGFTVLEREDNTLVAVLAISFAVLLALLGGRPIFKRRLRRRDA